ncbi:hypothetical protein [Lignipirellula cremea]|uniref:Uncharacterized protein n=1 Tax=Lignipirellula cremea TaxID=2528010 RepID=A0A518DWQ8_9BACT|nr:hypothetical protein [Lignipirellula cremea]QDU96276.1 hypothetical protein Pla8534_40960 [Lignipirellula cremea]
MYEVGDWVIYRVTKYSRHPGPRAKKITPTRQGDDYSYLVDKFWIVAEVREGGDLLLRTRRGKTREIAAEDPQLRRARFWERWLFASKFPALEDNEPAADPSAGD